MSKTQYTQLKDKRILVVEDVELNQYLARHIMESWGCVVEVVDDGSKAVDIINSSDFDLVLMDIQMPVMDGIEATKQIRKMDDPQKATIPIVALTANAMKAECDSYMRAGMNDWLGKPFQEPALFDTVVKNIRKQTRVETRTVSVTIEESKEVEVAEKLYDLAMVEAISGGDKSFIKKMLLLFLETAPGTLRDMQAASDRGDWLALSKQAHKLKSTIDSMGIVGLKQVIREIESGGKTGGDPQSLQEKTQVVQQHMLEVMDQVKREVV